jgi:hypothetical protein
MIAFSKLGHYGRLGNQLFQYAFLRVTAQRLGTDFFCPPWEGDQLFDLRDSPIRAEAPRGIDAFFDGAPEAGFSPRALTVADGTEIQGYFQSDKYYPDRSEVRRWYEFRPELKAAVEALYPVSRLDKAVSISLRLDTDYATTREYFPLYTQPYYRKGLELARADGPVLVFADRPDLARRFVTSLSGHEFIFIDNLTPHQQLYLMTLCRANVITNSTFAWWGGWLNLRQDRTVIAPAAWCRPGVPNAIANIVSDEWLTVRATVPLWDHFQVWRIRHAGETFGRVLARRRERQ